MRNLLSSLVLALVALVAAPSLAPAEDRQGRNLDLTATGDPGGVGTMAMAHALYRRGLADDDAVTVLVAARLAASVAAEPGGPGIRRASGTAPAATAAPDGPEGPPSAEDMFATADRLAQGDPRLAALIADARADATRGRLCCTTHMNSRLPAGQTDVWEIVRQAEAYTEIAIFGDESSNLDAVVTDESGNVICYDITPSDQFYCDWTPLWDGPFYITVENTGDAENLYLLEMNF